MEKHVHAGTRPVNKEQFTTLLLLLAELAVNAASDVMIQHTCMHKYIFQQQCVVSSREGALVFASPDLGCAPSKCILTELFTALPD